MNKPAYQASVGHVQPEGIWTLTLTKYHRDNLLLLIEALGYCSEGVAPFKLLNNGDWVGELYWMLGKKDCNAVGPGVEVQYALDENDAPNTTLAALREAVERWVADQRGGRVDEH